MKRFPAAIVILHLLCLLSPLKLVAQLGVFADSNLFHSNFNLIGTEDFESFSADTDFSFGSLALNGFSVEHIGPDPFANLVDVTPFQSSDQNVNGTAALRGYAGSSTRLGDVLVFHFDTPIHAFGGYWAQINDGFMQEVHMFINAELVAMPAISNGFFGIISNESFDVLTLRNTGENNDAFGIDDISFGTLSSIPEPSTYALWLSIAMCGPALRRAFRRGRWSGSSQ